MRRRLSDAVGARDAAAIAAALRKYGYRGLPRPVDVARWLRRQGADIDTPATGPGRASRASRPRQQAFRQALLAAYAGRCALSGCEVAPALEAAHVADWREENDVGAGILLRADLHRLLESGLLAFDARYTVVAAPAGYGELVGRRLRLPANRLQWPRLAPCGPRDEAASRTPVHGTEDPPHDARGAPVPEGRRELYQQACGERSEGVPLYARGEGRRRAGPGPRAPGPVDGTHRR